MISNYKIEDNFEIKLLFEKFNTPLTSQLTNPFKVVYAKKNVLFFYSLLFFNLIKNY